MYNNSLNFFLRIILHFKCLSEYLATAHVPMQIHHTWNISDHKKTNIKLCNIKKWKSKALLPVPKWKKKLHSNMAHYRKIKNDWNAAHMQPFSECVKALIL